MNECLFFYIKSFYYERIYVLTTVYSREPKVVHTYDLAFGKPQDSLSWQSRKSKY